MRFRLLPALLLAVGVACAGRAEAQVGVYLNPVFTRINISHVDTGPFAFLGENTTSRWFGGPAIGAYWDFYHARRFSAGIDIRDSIQHANNASLNSFIVAARIVGARPEERFQPYAELAVGAGSSKAPKSSVRTTKDEVMVLVGADYHLNRVVDWRVAEIGYGTLPTVSSAVYGGTTPIPSSTLLNVSSGLVFRFGK